VHIASYPLSDDLKEALRALRLASQFAWALGGLAIVLATAGAFGVFAFMVEERRREIGVRMMLGATSSTVVRTVIGGVRGPLLFGLGGGLLLSMIGAQLLRSNLYGLSPFDPITYLGIAAILTIAALFATWIPARRATRIDPAVTLRGE
jgi:putative ABC transport system permease protein